MKNQQHTFNKEEIGKVAQTPYSFKRLDVLIF